MDRKFGVISSSSLPSDSFPVVPYKKRLYQLSQMSSELDRNLMSLSDGSFSERHSVKPEYTSLDDSFKADLGACSSKNGSHLLYEEKPLADPLITNEKVVHSNFLDLNSFMNDKSNAVCLVKHGKDKCVSHSPARSLDPVEHSCSGRSPKFGSNNDLMDRTNWDLNIPMDAWDVTAITSVVGHCSNEDSSEQVTSPRSELETCFTKSHVDRGQKVAGVKAGALLVEMKCHFDEPTKSQITNDGMNNSELGLDLQLKPPSRPQLRIKWAPELSAELSLSLTSSSSIASATQEQVYEDKTTTKTNSYQSKGVNLLRFGSVKHESCDELSVNCNLAGSGDKKLGTDSIVKTEQLEEISHENLTKHAGTLAATEVNSDNYVSLQGQLYSEMGSNSSVPMKHTPNDASIVEPDNCLPDCGVIVEISGRTSSHRKDSENLDLHITNQGTVICKTPSVEDAFTDHGSVNSDLCDINNEAVNSACKGSDFHSVSSADVLHSTKQETVNTSCKITFVDSVSIAEETLKDKESADVVPLSVDLEAANMTCKYSDAVSVSIGDEACAGDQSGDAVRLGCSALGQTSLSNATKFLTPDYMPEGSAKMDCSDGEYYKSSKLGKPDSLKMDCFRVNGEGVRENMDVTSEFQKDEYNKVDGGSGDQKSADVDPLTADLEAANTTCKNSDADSVSIGEEVCVGDQYGDTVKLGCSAVGQTSLSNATKLLTPDCMSEGSAEMDCSDGEYYKSSKLDTADSLKMDCFQVNGEGIEESMDMTSKFQKDEYNKVHGGSGDQESPISSVLSCCKDNSVNLDIVEENLHLSDGKCADQNSKTLDLSSEKQDVGSICTKDLERSLACKRLKNTSNRLIKPSQSVITNRVIERKQKLVEQIGAKGDNSINTENQQMKAEKPMESIKHEDLPQRLKEGNDVTNALDDSMGNHQKFKNLSHYRKSNLFSGESKVEYDREIVGGKMYRQDGPISGTVRDEKYYSRPSKDGRDYRQYSQKRESDWVSCRNGGRFSSSQRHHDHDSNHRTGSSFHKTKYYRYPQPSIRSEVPHFYSAADPVVGDAVNRRAEGEKPWLSNYPRRSKYIHGQMPNEHIANEKFLRPEFMDDPLLYPQSHMHYGRDRSISPIPDTHLPLQSSPYRWCRTEEHAPDITFRGHPRLVRCQSPPVTSISRQSPHRPYFQGDVMNGVYGSPPAHPGLPYDVEGVQPLEEPDFPMPSRVLGKTIRRYDEEPVDGYLEPYVSQPPELSRELTNEYVDGLEGRCFAEPFDQHHIDTSGEHLPYVDDSHRPVRYHHDRVAYHDDMINFRQFEGGMRHRGGKIFNKVRNAWKDHKHLREPGAHSNGFKDFNQKRRRL